MKTTAQIQLDVQEELKFDPRIHDGDVGVSVQNGVVTLSGKIPTYAEKWAAEEAALKVAGVSTVVNDLKVNSALGSFDDQKVGEAINHSLSWNAWIPEGQVKAVVDDGWVTLSGKLSYNYQKDAALNVVKNVTGVRGVFNKMIVEPSISVKDIKAHIRKAIHRYAEKDAEQIEVSVANGEVRLTGKVHSRGGRAEAEFAAWQTPGVRSVKNSISVTHDY